MRTPSRLQPAQELQVRERHRTHLQTVLLARCARRDLARGWQSWLSQHLHGQKQRRLLGAAAARLWRPAAAAVLTLWREGWRAVQQQSLLDSQWRLASHQLQTLKAHSQDVATLRSELEATASAHERAVSRLQQQHERRLRESAHADRLVGSVLHPARRQCLSGLSKGSGRPYAAQRAA